MHGMSMRFAWHGGTTAANQEIEIDTFVGLRHVFDIHGLVATAHHSDDHAETILVNLLRGTEPKGLLGIPVKRPLCAKGKNRVSLIRPLLAVSRSEIEVYLKANALPSRKDHTNDDEYYTRNWIRKTLLPLMLKKQPRLREHLCELSEKLSRALAKRRQAPF